jgi:solute carrier family 25 phosphate transporter 3
MAPSTDDLKAKAEKAGSLAKEEFEKAAAKVQPKTGSMKLFSPEYYAACTFGGAIACVWNLNCTT